MNYLYNAIVITQDEVVKIAKLARLKLSQNEISKFQMQLSEILEYFTLLKDIDTTSVREDVSINGLSTVLRKDDPNHYPLDKSIVYANALDIEADYFKLDSKVL